MHSDAILLFAAIQSFHHISKCIHISPKLLEQYKPVNSLHVGRLIEFTAFHVRQEEHFYVPLYVTSVTTEVWSELAHESDEWRLTKAKHPPRTLECFSSPHMCVYVEWTFAYAIVFNVSYRKRTFP